MSTESTPASPASPASTPGHIEVESHGPVLLARLHGGPHALFDVAMADDLAALVDRADRDLDVRAVVFTGAHADRFLSHADVTWLQQGGVGFPPISTRTARLVARLATAINNTPGIRDIARRTRLKTLLQLDGIHSTFLKMNASGTVFIAALNGSALAIGAEFAWACDARIMADGEFAIGLSEVLLGLTPGGGGSQRLPRLIGAQRSLMAILEGKPFTPAEALAIGAVDEVVPQNEVVDRALELAQHLSLRSKGSMGAVKRSVYFGASLPLTEGLQLEHAEFLVRDQQQEAQRRMLGYIADTETTGELALLNPAKYAEALRTGRIGDTPAP